MTDDRFLTTRAVDPTAGPGLIEIGDRISGRVVVYGQVFTRWGVPLVYAQDSLTLPDDLRSIKLTQEHDYDRPLGHAIETENSADGLHMTFAIPDLPHTAQTRAEMHSRLRDGLSITTQLDTDTLAAVEARMWGEDESTEPITVRGELREATIATVPEFSGARVQHSQAQEEEAMTRQLITTTAEPSAPDLPATIGAPPGLADRIASAQTRPRSYATALAERIVGARTGSGGSGAAAVIASALADVTPGGNGAGNELAGLATQAMGELAETTYDPIYDAIVTRRPLTGMKVQGWRWAVPPTVGDYLGDKAEIPTNPAKLEWADENAQRIAGGHDLDRVYVDLGDPVTVLTSYWRLMTLDLQVKLDAKRLGAVQAAAGAAEAVPGTGTGVMGTVTQAILEGLKDVPDANYVVISADLWAAEGGKPESELPALLTGAGIFGELLPGTIVNGVGLTNEVIVGRRDAVNFYEFEPPVRLEAVNIAQAGIDAALYSYWAALSTATGAVKRYTLTAGAVARDAGGPSKSK